MKLGQQFNPYHMFVGSFIPNCIMKSKELTHADKLVWARLAQYAGKDGECYPKQAQIAEEVGASISTVKLSIKNLVDLELIEVIKPEGKDKLNHVHDKYIFIWNPLYESNILPTAENRLSGRPEIGPSYSKENPIKDTPYISPPSGKPDKYFIKQLPTPYQEHNDFIRIWKLYIDGRKKTTSQSVQLLVNKIRKQCRSDIPFAIKCFEEAIEGCWTSIYPNKEKYQKQERQWPKSEDGMHHTDPQEYANIPVEVMYNDWEARKEQKDEQKIERPKRRGSSLRV